MGYFLHSAGCGHKGTDRGRAKRPESTGLAQLAAVAPYPHFILLPGQLGEVWVWWGLAGELQEGPVLSKNADPGVVK